MDKHSEQQNRLSAQGDVTSSSMRHRGAASVGQEGSGVRECQISASLLGRQALSTGQSQMLTRSTVELHTAQLVGQTAGQGQQAEYQQKRSRSTRFCKILCCPLVRYQGSSQREPRIMVLTTTGPAANVSDDDRNTDPVQAAAASHETPRVMQFGTFLMQVHVGTPPQGSTLPSTVPCMAVLDTGSDVNYISARQIRELRLEDRVEEIHPPAAVYTLTMDPIYSLGMVTLTWNVNEKTTRYNTKFFILPEEVNPKFDFLIGRHLIAQHRFLTHNPSVMMYLRRLF